MLTYFFTTTDFVFSKVPLFFLADQLADREQWNIWLQRFVKECFVECRLSVSIIQDLPLVTCALWTDWGHWHWWTQIACIYYMNCSYFDWRFHFDCKQNADLWLLNTYISNRSPLPNLGFHWPPKDFFLLRSWVSAETCTNAQLDPKPLITHVAMQIKFSERPKTDVLNLRFQFDMQSVLALPVFVQNRIVWSKETKQKKGQAPSLPFDPQTPQMFSITFKLLFTRSLRIALKK